MTKSELKKAFYAESLKISDESCLYKKYKDLYDWIINIGKRSKQ
jgi:hypothetical protein